MQFWRSPEVLAGETGAQQWPTSSHHFHKASVGLLFASAARELLELGVVRNLAGEDKVEQVDVADVAFPHLPHGPGRFCVLRSLWSRSQPGKGR